MPIRHKLLFAIEMCLYFIYKYLYILLPRHINVFLSNFLFFFFFRIDLARSSTQHLLLVINDLLDSSQITLGKLRLNKDSVSLVNLVQSVIDLLSFQARQKGVDLIMKNKTMRLINLKTDETRLKQILINLVGNALKFTEKGSITIMIEDLNFKKPSLISEEKRPRAILLKVVDTGIGIQKNDIEQLFHDFSTLHEENAIKLNKHGVGLGLMISQKLVKALNNYREGARINVVSEIGKGSTFFFPLYDMEESNSNYSLKSFHSENIPSDKIPSEKFRNDNTVLSLKLPQSCFFSPPKKEKQLKRILIADDDELNLFVMTKNLESLENISIDKASNGRIALELVKENAKNNIFYSLIIMDNRMPEMDGIEATKEIRSLIFKGLLPDVSIIASTGDDFTENFNSLGFDGLLRKPYKKKDFLETIFNFI
jgi:CheY-like chemotaxis protein